MENDIRHANGLSSSHNVEVVANIEVNMPVDHCDTCHFPASSLASQGFEPHQNCELSRILGILALNLQVK